MILVTDQIRHRKSILVSFALMGEIFKGRGTEVVAWRGIPQDARIVGVDLDHSLEVVELLFEHESFPKILDGVAVCSDTLTSRSIYPNLFCDACRARWRNDLDDFYAAEDTELNKVSPK